MSNNYSKFKYDFIALRIEKHKIEKDERDSFYRVFRYGRSKIWL